MSDKIFTRNSLPLNAAFLLTQSGQIMIHVPHKIVALAAALLIPIAVAPADLRHPEKTFPDRIKAAEKVFVGVVVNHKILEGDWSQADLKVIQAIKGCKVGDLVPVTWRPQIGRFDVIDDQKGLALLSPQMKKRFFLRADTFADIKLAKEAQEAMEKLNKKGFERDYVEGAELSEELEKDVIELAKKCGVEHIAKISTRPAHRGASRGVTVYGAETIKGRIVSSKTLRINYRPWARPGRGPLPNDLLQGDFWGRKARTQEKTILKVGETEYRVHSIRGLKIEECESILSKLISRKYTVSERANDELIDGIDWSHPSGFYKRDSSISASFTDPNGSGSLYSLNVKLVDDELMINSVAEAMP